MSQSGTYLMLFIIGYWAGREGFFDDLWEKTTTTKGE